MKLLPTVACLLLVSALIYLALDFKNDIMSTLEGTNVNTPFNLPELNEYTYTIYFNFYTFALIHAIVGLIAAVVGLLKPETKKEELPE